MYRFLSGRLRQLGMTHDDLAAALGISAASMSRRFNGTTDWTLEEVYKALELCQATPEEFSVYFPPAAVMRKVEKGAPAPKRIIKARWRATGE